MSLDDIEKAVEKQGLNRFVITSPQQITGIGTAAVYASGEAFGGKFTISVPKTGKIETVILYDLDDEGVETEIWLFKEDFTATTDNAAFAPSDLDLLKVIGVISVRSFANAANNQIGIENGLSFPYVAPEGRIHCQCVTRGTPNIAVGNIPYISLGIERNDV